MQCYIYNIYILKVCNICTIDISFYPTATTTSACKGTQRVVGPCALGTPNKKLVPRKICTKRSIRPMQLFFSFDKESLKCCLCVGFLCVLFRISVVERRHRKSMVFWICEKLGVSFAGIYRDFLGDISNL